MIHPHCLLGHLIRLQKLELRHLFVLERLAKNPIIWQYLLAEGWREDVFWSWASETLEGQKTGKYIAFAVIDNKTGDVIGTTRFQDIDIAHNKTDIGWTWYDPSVWGRGFNFEAKNLMFTHAFEVWKVQRVGFKVDEHNHRSQRALEKVGTSREGFIRKHLIRPDGSSRSSFLYGITDDEWFESIKKMLQNRVVEAIIKQKSIHNVLENSDLIRA
jgi:N-acetyltransferase